MTPRHDLRLVPSALVAWACAAAVSYGEARVAALAAGALAAATLAATVYRRTVAAALLLPTVAAGAVLLVGGARIGAEEPLAAHTGSSDAVWCAVAASDPEPTEPDRFSGEARVRVDLDVTAVGHASVLPEDGDADVCHADGAAGALPSASGRVVVVAGGAWAAVHAGDRLQVTGALEPAGPGRTVALAWDPRLISSAPPTGAARVVAAVRERFRDVTAVLDDEVRGLVRGLVIGDTTEMPAAQADDMRAVGLTHLTAVSGTHFAVVSGLLGVALRRLRLRRVGRAAGLMLGMLAFSMLVLPQPSVMRALAMATVGAAAALWGRPAQAMPALAAAVLCLLAWDPHLATEPGMLLSVSAVCGIVLLAPALRRSLSRPLGSGAAAALSVPLAAQLACAPVLVLLRPTFSLWTVPANIAAAPLAAPVIALGAVSVVAAAVGCPGTALMVRVLGMLTIPIARLAHLLASWPGASLPWPPGAAGLVGSAALLLGVSVAVAAKPRFARIAGAVLVVAVALWGFRGGWVAGTTSVPADWAIVVCDVGQGDMTVVRAGQDSAVVIDTGPGGGAAECLRALGVRHVSLLVLTHPHADHDGAIGEIAQVADIRAAWWSAAATGTAGRRAAAALDALDVTAAVPEAGTSVSVGQAGLTVLPTDGTAGHAPADPDDESAVNDQSLALVAQSGGVTALLLGDLERGSQDDLARAGGPWTVDLVKVAHHGSASQSEALAARVDATVAAVSVGADNSYGHPSASAVDLYGATGATVVRTDLCGTIALTSQGGIAVSSGCPTPMAG
ncbi:ComEC/Rec2 family competence protein [Demequina capsici]|uniref:ComEC/Rec2 family competence protein n=1 Tax=Demequina capsici TaxID=3075620 RepID=A0AA96JGV8_9MICO|nr:ComEC/Rec2 family competence protein [Demequina sp. PMTSA13]WNM28349.1 ComEC/Rec2 family competence protein [Demequina sp. PMTSA13]